MGIELELGFLLTCQILGAETFARFEIETPVWRKILKWTLVAALTLGLYQVIGHWSILAPTGLGLAGLAFHFVWCRNNGIDPWRATPRRRYYELRGWAWIDEPRSEAQRLGGGVRRQSSSRYRVDSQGRIEFVSAEWLAFARENGAAHLDRDTLLGKPLSDFIADEETRYLYRLCFDAARTRGSNIAIPFRSDSPSLRRYMELMIVPVEDGALELSAWIRREEPRAYVRLLDPSIDRSSDLLRICSWCKRVLAPPNEWLEVEDAVRRLKLFDAAVLPNLTHGACNECGAKIEAELEL